LSPEERGVEGRKPAVSVVVIAHNEEGVIGRCLESLLSQRWDEFEVVLIDDASTDETLRVALSTARSDTLGRIRVFPLGKRVGVSRAFNLGVSLSRYPVLAFTGSDCMPSPGWIAELVRAMGRERTQAATCRVSSSQGTRWARAEDRKIEAWTRGRLRRNLPFLIGANMAITRELFNDLGGFDEGLVSKVDRDLGRRILESGHGISYAHGARVDHEHPARLSEYFGRGRWYARGLCAYNLKHHGAWYRGSDFWRMTELVWLLLSLATLAIAATAVTGPQFTLPLLAACGLSLVLAFRRDVAILFNVIARKMPLDSFIMDLVFHTGEKAGCLEHLSGRGT